MGSIAIVPCHLDAWADSGMGRKNGWGSQGRDLSIAVEVCSNYCRSHETVLMCAYIYQSRADRERDGRRRREKSKKQRESWSLSTEALTALPSGCDSGGHSTNCDDISIYISQLASELIFKLPPHQHCD